MTAQPLRKELTTEDAREIIAWQDNYPYEGEHNEAWASDFDRWLAGVKADAWDEGKAEERRFQRRHFGEWWIVNNPYRQARSNAVPKEGA